jgi:hypothetical protein
MIRYKTNWELPVTSAERGRTRRHADMLNRY